VSPFRYLGRRLASLIFILLGVTLLTFILTHAIPGVDPLAAYVTQSTPISQYPAIAKFYGLDKPLYEQYFYYLWNLMHGNWGWSTTAVMPVAQAIESYFPATLELTVVALVISTTLGILLGIVSALKSNRLPDHIARIFSISTISVPSFWLGLLFQVFFFLELETHGLPYLPSNGRVDEKIALIHPLHQITGLYLVDSLITANWPFFESALTHIILPALTLALVTTGIKARVVRASVLEVLKSEIVTAALARGVPWRVVIFRHVLKNSLVPIISVVGLSFAYLLTGAVLVETVFSWNGMGQWAAGAILNNDSAAIMGFALICAVIFVVINLIVDIVYTFVDPRIRIT
jgi:ABC-type dipeptide/oligopeptide/nickel transport system permease component